MMTAAAKSEKLIRLTADAHRRSGAIWGACRYSLLRGHGQKRVVRQTMLFWELCYNGRQRLAKRQLNSPIGSVVELKSRN
jgi:hypothetical protein